MATEERVFVSKTSGADESWKPASKERAATAEDVRTGWYLSTREMQGKDGPFNIHMFEKEDGTTFDLAGTTALNDIIMNQTSVGAFVEIRWLGFLPSKKAGGRPYHQWSVGEYAPMSRKPSFNDAPAKNQAAVNEVVAGSGNSNVPLPTPASNPTDDLPF